MTDNYNYYENANRSSNDRFNRQDDIRFHTPRPLGSALSSRSGQASVASTTSRSTTRSHERFYTPRASAMSARSYGSTRSQMSGRSLATARSNISSDSASSNSFRTSRTSTSFSSPSAYISNNRNRTVNPHTISHRRQTISSFDREMDLEAASTSIHPSSTIHNNTAQQFSNARANNNNNGSQDIFSLARHARVQEVEELLIRGVPITSTDENGNGILSIGCQNGSKRICKLALRFGADINQQNSSGNTPLHYCFLYQKDSLGRYLISKGADETIRNNDGRLYSEVGR